MVRYFLKLSYLTIGYIDMIANGNVNKILREEPALISEFRNIFLFGQLLPSELVEQILIGEVHHDY